MRRITAVSAAVAGSLAIAVAGCTAAVNTRDSAARVTAVPVSVQRATGVPAGLQRFYSQTVNWEPCNPSWAIASGVADNSNEALQAVAGFQCAELTVPLDYANPGGATIQLAMNRLPASNAAQRIGPLLTNPGGPGGSGLEYVFNARKFLTEQLRARYDIVGMDPRGVGLSSPVQCPPTAEQQQQVEQNPTPLVEATVTAQACAQTAGSLIPYVGTENAARDLDIARAVLGGSQPATSAAPPTEPKGSTGSGAKLDYLGTSYGTLLGQV